MHSLKIDKMINISGVLSVSGLCDMDDVTIFVSSKVCLTWLMQPSLLLWTMISVFLCLWFQIYVFINIEISQKSIYIHCCQLSWNYFFVCQTQVLISFSRHQYLPLIVLLSEGLRKYTPFLLRISHIVTIISKDI